MKIEIAESLFLSWLRHVRGCGIAQLNWKPSKTWGVANRDRVENLFEKSRDFFKLDQELDLYKKNRSVSQLIQQAEIDAIGICDLRERPSIIAVDVAFHESGLNYGAKDKTVASVVKKILRTLLALESYFPDFSREIIFATPKLHNAVKAPLEDAMRAVEQFLEQNSISAECRVIANADFFNEIAIPVSNLTSEVADTGELFMRSIQLMQMAPSAANQPQSLPSPSSVKSGTSPAMEIKIGKLVQQEFKSLLDGDTLTVTEIEQLCTKEYSNRVFGIRYPALKRSGNQLDRFDQEGHARYYSELLPGGFLLCNDWYDRNRQRFLKWAKENRTDAESNRD